MSLVVFFDRPELGLAGLVGGKGSNLIALTAAGFPVPPGFVVTAEAYRQFLSGLDWLDAELAGFDFLHPHVLREQCARLRQRLGQRALPPLVSQTIRAALVKIGSADGDAFAVRSSSTFEDLAQAAFAGQHDTYLNVQGAEAIITKVRDCFVSLWGDRAVLYRHHQGFSQRESCMAAVVQRQVECECAGVGFSVHPVTGRLDRMAIDANYGLGESVVAGECEIDHFELDKKTLAIVERTIGHKEQMVVALPSGVAQRAVPAAQADAPCLSDEQLQAIGQLLQKVEAHYGWPQDIEWGWRDGKLYQFQSRPVTTIPPRWTRDESAERFPLPMTPLTWDFIRAAFRGSMAHSMALMGLPPLGGDWFELIDNYVYGNQNAVELVAAYRPLRARSIPELIAEIPDLRERYSWVLDLPVHWARDLDRYLIRLGRLSAVTLDVLSLQEIWRHMLDILEVAAEYFRPNIAISMTQAFLHRILHALVGMAVGPEQALAAVDGLLAGCETKTAVVNRELHELAQLLERTPALRGALLQTSGKSFWEQGLAERSPEFAARLARFLEDHGHREMDMDYFHPTWASQPWIVLDSLTLILRSGLRDDPAETARRQRKRYFETEHQFLGGVPEPLRFFFRELIRLGRTYTTLDDLEHYQTTRINPVARRAALALGQRLVQGGILDAPEDVFFAHKTDLEALIAAPAATADRFRRAVCETKRSYEASRRQTPAWTLDETTVPSEAAGGKLLRGLPGSPGQAIGPCFLVSEPEQFARFPQGAILVARTTNPAWTPLFYSASGLITESGGPLSHGAVTAREMRLPAVMSLRRAMTLFQDGQVVTVDGTQGTVRLE